MFGARGYGGGLTQRPYRKTGVLPATHRAPDFRGAASVFWPFMRSAAFARGGLTQYGQSDRWTCKAERLFHASARSRYHLTYTASPEEAEFVGLTAVVGTIQLYR